VRSKKRAIDRALVGKLARFIRAHALRVLAALEGIHAPCVRAVVGLNHGKALQRRFDADGTIVGFAVQPLLGLFVGKLEVTREAQLSPADDGVDGRDLVCAAARGQILRNKFIRCLRASRSGKAKQQERRSRRIQSPIHVEILDRKTHPPPRVVLAGNSPIIARASILAAKGNVIVTRAGRFFEARFKGSLRRMLAAHGRIASGGEAR
jgi:hypothetical protein